MTKTRRKFDKEFKLMALELCESEKTIVEVGRELGIRAELLYRWRAEKHRYQQGSFSGHGKQNLTEDQRQIAALKKKLRAAELERDILKKAVGIFSKSDSKSINL